MQYLGEKIIGCGRKMSLPNYLAHGTMGEERLMRLMPYCKLDNDIFSLRLDPYEFEVYAYLVS